MKRKKDILITDDDLIDGLFDDEGNEILPCLRDKYETKRKLKKYLSHWRKYHKVPYSLLFGEISYSKQDLIEWARSRKKQNQQRKAS